jgi:hypothetical protein
MVTPGPGSQRRRAVRRFVAVAIVAATTFSCRTLPFPDPHLEGEYGMALKQWTRTVALYSGLETRAFVRLVYLSPQFVEAQAKQLSKMRAELPDQAAATLQKLRDDNRNPTFFAVTYIPDKTANDWQNKDSVWRIALNLGYGEQSPTSVTRFEPLFNAELRALYPYLDDYSVAYRIQFPQPRAPAASPGGQQVNFTPTEATVVIAGALGKMTFHYRLDGGAEQPSVGEQPVPEQKRPETPQSPSPH